MRRRRASTERRRTSSWKHGRRQVQLQRPDVSTDMFQQPLEGRYRQL